MPRQYSTDRRDTNEPALIKMMKWLAPNAVIVSMRPGQGFDLLWTTAGWSEHVEIKNPDERWKLTAQEIEMQTRLESIGRRLWILETERDVKSMWELLS